MIFKFLTPFILWVYSLYRRIIDVDDYKIVNKTLEYEIDWQEDTYSPGEFWSNEMRYWSPYNLSHFVDITYVDIRKEPVPKNVKNPIIRIKYYYKNKVYKYITKDFEYAWPPRDSSDVNFIMPIFKALLMDKEGQAKRDITQKLCRYAGPKNNFFGEDILIRDMFYYDDETLKKEYPYLVVSDVMNNVKIVETDKKTTALF